MAYLFRLPEVTRLTVGQQAAVYQPNPIALSGGPGTGKSVVLLWRHIRNYDITNSSRKKSLLLTFTITLEFYLAATAKTKNVNSGNEVSRIKLWTGKTFTRKYYDEIIVDEAQDVELERFNLIKDNSKFVSYGADPHQSLYLSEDELKRLMNGLKTRFSTNKDYPLDENFRNTIEIIQFVRALFPHRKINLSNVRGVKPFLIVANNKAKQNEALFDVINQFKSVSHNIVVLVPLSNDVDIYFDLISNSGILKNTAVSCSKYSSKDREIKAIHNIHITTFKSSKGTEFDTVIIPDFGEMENIINDGVKYKMIEDSDYYVALTRASRNLYLISQNLPSFLLRSDAQKNTYNKEQV
jgi:superfamily I DNA/RNA helicase